MKYRVMTARNSISLTIEEAIVEASSEEDARQKVLSGDCLEVDIIECSDLSELSNEIVSVLKIEE